MVRQNSSPAQEKIPGKKPDDLTGAKAGTKMKFIRLRQFW
jgi:hypothetical protein